MNYLDDFLKSFGNLALRIFKTTAETIPIIKLTIVLGILSTTEPPAVIVVSTAC